MAIWFTAFGSMTRYKYEWSLVLHACCIVGPHCYGVAEGQINCTLPPQYTIYIIQASMKEFKYSGAVIDIFDWISVF